MIKGPASSAAVVGDAGLIVEEVVETWLWWGWCGGAAAGHGHGRAEHSVLCQQSDVGVHSPQLILRAEVTRHSLEYTAYATIASPKLRHSSDATVRAPELLRTLGPPFFSPPPLSRS
jgi:hypothetical protein